MGLEKPLDAVVEADLLELIADATPEGQKIEYKRAVNLQGEEAKREFFADISSFANASGGDLIYGIDAPKGVATTLIPLDNFDPDAMKLKLGQLCATHINPPIHGLRFKEIPLSAGGNALIARIPKTWNGPHMVTFNGSDKFFVRLDNGKKSMTCPELRRSFLLSDSLAQRIRNFRLERLGHIAANETPVPLAESTKIVLHIMPLASFEQDMEIDLKLAQHENTLAVPMNSHAVGSWGPLMFNFDGLLSTTRLRNKMEACSYLQIFRNGCIEAVDAHTLGLVDGDNYFTDAYECVVLGALDSYFKLLINLNVSAPAFLGLSLIGLKGFKMLAGRQFSHGVCNREHLNVPEVSTESFANAISVMQPSFDIVWQTFGFERCYNYDQNSKWVGGFLVK